MGSWFCNLQIRRKDSITNKALDDCLIQIMDQRGYQLTNSADEADSVITILQSKGSEWITVCSDLFAHDDSDSCAKVAAPISAQLHTDVLGVACFDSDYLYLNLINAEEQSDAWVGIGKGKTVGITRRNNLTAWKKKVSDHPVFAEKAKSQYVIADEFLQHAAPCLGLPVLQATASGHDLYQTEQEIETRCLWFVCREPDINAEKVCLVHYRKSIPCLIGEDLCITAINVGAESRGLSVYFLGPYVEHDEIVFSDMSFGRLGEAVPVELKKEKLQDGQWVYAYHDPDFLIPPKVPNRLSKDKRARMAAEKMFAVSFTPYGNSRKLLDISVAFVPHENREGNTVWNVWKPHGSKKEYIDYYNKITKRVRAMVGDESMPLLKVEDYDE